MYLSFLTSILVVETTVSSFAPNIQATESICFSKMNSGEKCSAWRNNNLPPSISIAGTTLGCNIAIQLLQASQPLKC